MSFVGLGGPARDVPQVVSAVDGVSFIAAFGAQQFLTTPFPATISFTGLRFDIIVTGIPDTAADRTYRDVFLEVLGENVAVVPEPPTFEQLGVGALALLTLGFAQRRRSSSARSFAFRGASQEVNALRDGA